MLLAKETYITFPVSPGAGCNVTDDGAPFGNYNKAIHNEKENIDYFNFTR